MIIDLGGNLPKWARWLIGGAIVVAAIVLSVATADLGATLACVLGTGFATSVAGGAIGGAVVGAVSGAMISAGTQIIKNGFDNFSWKEVGISALKGAIGGAIAGGIFGYFKYILSPHKIANGISGLSKIEEKMNTVFTPLKSLNSLSKMPFASSNITKTVATVANNYNNLYSAYITAQSTYSFTIASANIVYFGLENLSSNLIGLLLQLLL